jgi:catechol 2,3-dioxygenase-like lactoylglutathione lyase family enzyme
VIEVEQVDFVSVPTRDVTSAVSWYSDVFGFPRSEVSEGEVEAPNVTLAFWNPERDGEEFVPNAAGIALRVVDVASAVEDVRAAGGVVVGIEDTGVCHMGFVEDPDGNTVILHRRYAPRAATSAPEVHPRYGSTDGAQS